MKADKLKYNYAVKNLGADHNIKLYSDLMNAYTERDRREGYGVPCEIQTREEWDRDVMAYVTEVTQNEND